MRRDATIGSLLFAVSMLISTVCRGGESCPTGEKRLNSSEPCFPAVLVEFLYCVKQSTGGVVEIVKKDDQSKSSGYEVQVAGKASGVVVKGEASGGFSTATVTKEVSDLSEKLAPEMTATCKAIADESLKVSPVKKPSPNRSESDARKESMEKKPPPSGAQIQDAIVALWEVAGSQYKSPGGRTYKEDATFYYENSPVDYVTPNASFHLALSRKVTDINHEYERVTHTYSFNVQEISVSKVALDEDSPLRISCKSGAPACVKDHAIWEKCSSRNNCYQESYPPSTTENYGAVDLPVFNGKQGKVLDAFDDLARSILIPQTGQ